MLFKKNQLPSATAIIVAAGSGTRMGSNVNKQFIMIDNMPVLAHTLLNFQNAKTIESIIIVTKPESILTVSDLAREFGITKVAHIVPGGATRQESVSCGLALSENGRLVAIHDGARPFVSPEKIDELVLAAEKYGSSAPGVVPKDTVKSVTTSSNVLETIDRNSLRLIQTPQVFHADELKLAFLRAAESGFEGTDDCSVAEFAGFQVHIVDGEYTNIKVTTPEDLPVAEAIYNFLKK